MTAPRIFSPEYYSRMRALESASWWNAGMRDLAARLLRQAGLPEAGVLLDAGCGSGQTMHWFRQMWPGWRTIGIDVAKTGLQAALANSGETVVAGSVLALPIDQASVDGIISLDLLQHLPLGGGDLAALREFRRVLRPGGVLLIRTNAQAWPPVPDDSVHDFHKYTPGELRHRLATAGFRIQRLGRVNALLGLMEIPRELRSQRIGGTGYAGLLSSVPKPGLAWHLKRRWLDLEGRFVAAGGSVPLGRSLLATALATEGDGP